MLQFAPELWTDLIGEIRSFSDQLEGEDYWIAVQRRLKPDYIPRGDGYIDLNSAGLGQTFDPVLIERAQSIDAYNHVPSMRMNQLRVAGEALRDELATFTSLPVDQIDFVRNATEALHVAIAGIELEAGDEILLSAYTYPTVMAACQTRAKRTGVHLKIIDDYRAQPEEIIETYVDAVTRRTKAIVLTDVINTVGLQLPTKEIIQAMPDHVLYRIVDAAQSLGNTRQDLSSLGATHIGASLHKWLGLPVGLGMLYVQSDYRSRTWALFGNPQDALHKYEHYGTTDLSPRVAGILAMSIYNEIGYSRIKDRLSDLGLYLTERMLEFTDIQLLSPSHPELRTNILLFKHRHKPHHDWWVELRKKHHIHVVKFDVNGYQGIRFSPNMLILKADLDEVISRLTSG